MELKSSIEWENMKSQMISDFALYFIEDNVLMYDQDVAKIITGFDYYIPEISKAEVVARTTPKYYRLTELLQKFNNQLQDCKELFLIRVMTR